MCISLLLLFSYFGFYSQQDLGQTRVIESSAEFQQALELIDDVYSSAGQLNDHLKTVKVRSRAASLMWRIDPENGKQQFLSLWNLVNNQLADSGSLNLAQTEILTQLLPLDRKLADSLLQSSVDNEIMSDKVSLTQQLNGNRGKASRLLNLAIRSIEESPESAEWLLETELKNGYSYPLHAAINKLATFDRTRSDRIIKQLLKWVDVSGTDNSIVAAQQLFYNFFSNKLKGALSIYHNSNSDNRQLYVRTAVKALARAQSTNKVVRSAEDQRIVSMSRALLAVQLNSISREIPGLEAEYIEQISLAARNLRSDIPRELDGIYSTNDNGKSTPDQLEGSSVPGRDIEGREVYATITAKAVALTEIRSLIDAREIPEALTKIMLYEDRNLQVTLLLDLRQAIMEEKESHFSRYVTKGVMDLLSELPNTARKTEILLMLLGTAHPVERRQDIAQFWELFNRMIESTNSLTNGEDKMATSSLFRKAVIIASQIDNARTINRIKELQPKLFEFLAKLALAESMLDKKSNQNELK